MNKLFWISCAGMLALAGCGSAPPRPVGPSMSSIYSNITEQGSRDAVDLLREGMRQKQTYGTTDPYIPLRTPEIVIPIWVPPHVDPVTGDRIDGHWEHAVIQNSHWDTGDGNNSN